MLILNRGAFLATFLPGEHLKEVSVVPTAQLGMIKDDQAPSTLCPCSTETHHVEPSG